MRNKLIWILTFALILSTGLGLAKANGMLDFLDYAESQEGSYGYNSRDVLTIANITNSYVDIESPVIKSGTKDISSYLFIASTERAGRNPVAFRCFDNVSINGNKFSVGLTTSSLDRSEIYYIYATPLDSLPGVGVYNGSCSASEASQFLEVAYSAGNDSTTNGLDPCFIIEDKFYGEGKDCENHKNPGSTNIYSVTGISHVYDGKNIKITWTSYSNVKLDIFLWDESRGSFIGLGSANSEDGSFTFTKRHDGDHIIKIRPSDGSQEINYTAHYKETAGPEVTPTTPVKPVVVGPKENIMMIIIGTLVLYIVYRFATRKRS